MAFRLYKDHQGSVEDFTDQASYRFNDSGFLIIDMGDNVKRVYSPTGWTYIEETRTPSDNAGRVVAM
jgi:hypothetical protein